MLGVTVVGDLVVLVLFSLSEAFAVAQCEGGGFNGGDFCITILSLVAAVGIGRVIGNLVVFMLWCPRLHAEYTVLPLGFIIFVFTEWFTIYSLHAFGVSINFDALLIVIVAGYVVTNHSKNRIRLLQILAKAGPIIFIPFFTKIGVELNLSVLLLSLGFAVMVAIIRATAIFTSIWAAGCVRAYMHET